MNKKLKQKGHNEYEIVIPMSDETIKNIKANATKIVLGASIAGIMMFGGQSAKAESVHEPQAIIQTAETQNEAEKKELYLEIDKLMSFNKAARVENDEQKFAERKIQNANTESVYLEENLHQSSVRDEASADAVIETTSIAEKGQSESNDETISAISSKETDEESVLNNAENKKDFEAEIVSVASIDGKEAETKTEISKASEESDVRKAASSEDDKNLETVSGAEAEKNIEEKVQTDEAKETITEDKTVETSEVQSEEEKTHPEESGQTEKTGEKSELSLDGFINNKGIEDLFDVDKISEVEEKPEAQGAGETEVQPAEESQAQETTEPNYGEDEKEIKDYDGSERYKETDLQQGNVNQTQYDTDEKKVKDGFKFELKNPSAESKSKTEWGYQITIDKKTGQRTYTRITVTDGGRVPAGTGEKPMMKPGDKLVDGSTESPAVNFKPDENGEVTGTRQRNYNYEASEETLKNINSQDNPSISFGMKDNYITENPRIKYFGENFELNYMVNPWPNENDKLEQLKLNGKYDKKVFVQGQDIDTGIKVDNIDDNAKERLVGQVYNPITGKIVPGASAYIGDNGNIHIKMPEGAVTKDENGKTVINKNSIFNTPEYKALQNLDVKFFARPRTKAEFENIAKTGENSFGEKVKGTYVETGAGSATIKHKDQDIVIDKQGIDRYDHYNKIGEFKLNLDDTRYYDQSFKDGHKEDTSEKTYSKVKPGEDFNVEMFMPDKENKKPNQKSAEEMNEADKNGQASGRVNMDFLNKENEGKAPEDQWKVKVDPHDISKFTITPPKSAKAGDFVAVPVEYTYTNGSQDVHWFHFVVQESTYIKPEYDAQVNYPVNEQTSEATVAQDDKRIKPNSYSLPDTLETDDAGNKIAKDDKGNKWTVKVDEKTGKVTAKPVNPKAFDGGEKLTVPVISHYVDEQKPGEDITEEANAYFVIEEKANMTPRYNAKAGKSGDQLSSDVILNTEDKYNRRPGKYTLDSPTYTDDKGNTWNVSIDENTGKVTATVPNAAEGKTIDGALLNIPVTAHYYEEDAEGNKVESGTKTAEVQFVAYGTNGKVEKTEEIPFETKVEKNPNLKKGEIKVITEGKKGSKKVTYTIEDSKIIKEEEQELEAPQVREIHVGEGVNDGTHKIEEKIEIGFETEIQFDDSLAPGETKEIQKGEAGEKKRDITLTIEDGNVTKTETGEFTETKAPKKRIIKVGRNTEGKVEHKEELPFKYKIEEVDTLKKGEYKIVKPGKVGTKTTTWTIKNSKIDGEPTVTEVAAEDALIQVGKGTNDGTHEITEKKELTFETRYEYDENLEVGQREETGGEPGEQERTNTLVIKDGQVTETKEGEFKTTKDPVDKVIKIGIKPIVKEVEKPFETEYVYDENVEMGKEEEVTPGEKGKVTITTSYDKDQNKLITKEETKDPVKRVVKVGIKPVVKEEQIPAGRTYKHNPELKAGEINKIKDGTPGKVTVTTTFNKETGKIETKVERIEPTDTEYEYGSKTEGKLKVESDLPFEVEIVEDPEMEAGKTETVQEGKLGKRETTITIENSKEVSRETNVIEEPIKKIIKVGTKNVCDIPEQPDKPEDPDTPDKPEEPGTPDKPEEPGTPDKPEEPGTPDKPEEPGTPDKPTVPDESKVPGEPSVPDEPSVPETPNEPNGGETTETEEKPSEKEEAPEEKSEKPEEKAEEKAGDSDVESKEDKVDETEEVVEDDIKTSDGNNDSDGADENKRLPKTGDGVNRSLYAYIMGLMGSAMMAIGVKKKNKESLDEE